MSYKVHQGNVFGRLGESIGKSLSEQIPKEVERQRLASGLEKLGQQENLTPFQQFAGLSSLPGVTPQMIQSGSDLLRQQAKGQALSQIKPSVFPGSEQQVNGQQNNGSKFSSITNPLDLEKAVEGYIPPTQQDILANAAKMYNSNPGLYNKDPQKAIEAAEQAALRDESIVNAHEARLSKTREIEKNVKESLRSHSKELQAESKIPPDLYSKIESDALNAVKPISKGGEGLTQEQATKKYGELIDDAARDYSSLSTIGDSKQILFKPAKETQSTIDSLRKSFEKRNDLENFAKLLIADHGLSPSMAYQQAYPVQNSASLYNQLQSIPDNFKGREQRLVGDEQNSIFKKVLDSMTDKDSPLAIAQYLKSKSYDPVDWIDYVSKNSKDLNPRQSRETRMSRPAFNKLNDYWLFPDYK